MGRCPGTKALVKANGMAIASAVTKEASFSLVIGSAISLKRERSFFIYEKFLNQKNGLFFLFNHS